MTRTLRPGDSVQLDGIEHTVVGVSGPSAQLRSPTGEQQLRYVGEIIDDASTPGAMSEIALAARLAELPEPVVEQARFWERHVREVLHGSPGRYDPNVTTQQERGETKARELVTAGHEVSARTIRRMCRQYDTEGLWGLVDKRQARRASPVGRADPRVVAAIVAAMEAETTTSTGTRSRLARRVEQRLRAEHGEEVSLPSRATLYRLMAALDAGRHTFDAATTRRSTAGRPPGAFTATSAARPGEQVQIDATPLDVMVSYADGVEGRAEVLQAVDVATRSICAALVVPVAGKAVDAALLLARMLVPEPMRPGWPEALRMSSSVLPHQQLIDVDERLRHAAARPMIVPDTIVIDHGKVFLSETFINACATLGISIQPAQPHTPTDKSVVERTFGSVNTLFAQHLAAYTGPNVTRRGRDIALQQTVTVEELQDLLDQWIVAVWQNRPHDALRDPLNPTTILSPNQMYAALVSQAGYLPVPFGPEDYIGLMPVAWRSVNAYGVRLHSRTYDSDQLNPLRHQPSGVKARDDKWEVRYDPYDIRRAWLRSPDSTWIELAWTHAGALTQPFSQDVWKHARALAADSGDADEAGIRQAAEDLLVRAETAGTATKAQRRAVARSNSRNHSPVTALAPPAPKGQAALDEVADGTAEREGDEALAAVIPFGIYDPAAEAGRFPG